MDTSTPRRKDTRQRIQDVALELFAEHGYEKTSLREIAEQLEVTKAALYYHFKTKEDILVSAYDGLTSPVDELIAWGRDQQPTLEVKKELLRRYAATLREAEQLFRFMHENQATMRDLRIGDTFKSRVRELMEIITAGSSTMPDTVRCFSALMTLHSIFFSLTDVEGDPEEKRNATLEVAFDLVTQAHRDA